MKLLLTSWMVTFFIYMNSNNAILRECDMP